MVSFDARERYCLSLIIANGGQITFDKLRTVIDVYRESYEDLKESYFKSGRPIRITLNKLIKRKIITISKGIYEIDPIITAGFVSENYADILSGMKNYYGYKRQYVLEFDVKDALFILKEGSYYILDYESLLEEINRTYMTYKNTDNYKSVITGCGRCVEIMLDHIIEDCSLIVKTKGYGNIIRQINRDNSDFMNKIKKGDRQDWKLFLNGCQLIYDFRNKRGAHSGDYWKIEEIAHSFLIMTMYFVYYYLYELIY